MENGEVCHRLGFYAGGERKPWRVFTISDTFVPEVYWLHSFPDFSLQSEFSCLFHKQDLPQAPATPQKREKYHNHYLKSGPSGAFSACKCVQFESPGLFFHLLWYAYLIHRPRLDLIWCTLVQGWWWATSEGLRVCCFLCFICWPTVLIYCASSWFYLHMKYWEHFNLLAMNNDS